MAEAPCNDPGTPPAGKWVPEFAAGGRGAGVPRPSPFHTCRGPEASVIRRARGTLLAHATPPGGPAGSQPPVPPDLLACADRQLIRCDPNRSSETRLTL